MKASAPNGYEYLPDELTSLPVDSAVSTPMDAWITLPEPPTAGIPGDFLIAFRRSD